VKRECFLQQVGKCLCKKSVFYLVVLLFAKRDIALHVNQN
jgi:hypothetical protein